MRGTLPWPRSAGAWSDADDSGLRAYFEQEWRIDSPRKIEDALAVATVTNAFHPVRDYLTPLVWDGAPRVDTLLIDYLRGRRHAVRARGHAQGARRRGRARHAPRREVRQHDRQRPGRRASGSRRCPRAWPGRWFSDTLLDVHSKDAYDALAGVWIVEMGELSATKKADIDAVKHFLSKSKDTYRKAYARHTVEQERQCIFWGHLERARVPARPHRQPPLLARLRLGRIAPRAVGLDRRGHRAGLGRGAHDVRGGRAADAQRRRDPARRGRAGRAHRDRRARGHARRVPRRARAEGWYEMGVSDRRAYVRDVLDNGADEALGEERTKVAVAEVWVELLDGKPGQIHPAKAAEIRAALDAMPGWSLSTADRSRARFGTGYGRQTAWLRD